MKKIICAMGALLAGSVSINAQATPPSCAGLPSHAELTSALKAAVFLAESNSGGEGAATNGGLDLDMWATVVDRNGMVCAVTRSGELGDQWPGSRVISAQKANTANAFSLEGLALSTANLFEPVQPGQSLFGLQHSNPVNTDAAYKGPATNYGSANDPMVGTMIGGVNVFGGGLALYDETGALLGAVGVSGDTSCADHNIAWRVRDIVGLDFVPFGISATGDDNIVFGLGGGFGHPNCLGADNEGVNAAVLGVHPIGVNP